MAKVDQEGNRVRAVLLVNTSLTSIQLHEHLDRLKRLGVTFVSDPIGWMRRPGEVFGPQRSVPAYEALWCKWALAGKSHSCRVLFHWESDGRNRLIFEVDEAVFFIGNSLYFNPHEPRFEEVFRCFKSILVEFIVTWRPILALIDYEADPLWNEGPGIFADVAWGNFYSSELISAWDPSTLDRLGGTVDDLTMLESTGLLFFLHPLEVNQAWSSRHQAVHNMLI